MQIIENIIRKILILFGIIKEEKDLLKEKNIYKKKNIMTDYEYKFYLILKELEKYNYKVIPQVNLATIVEKVNNKKYYTELFRNIDFVIFNKDLTYANEKSYVLNRVLRSITTNNNNNIEPTNNKIETS